MGGHGFALVRERYCKDSRVLERPLAKFLEHAFAQKIGIALASLGKLDDALGDDFVSAIRAFGKTECDPGHFERDPDDAPDFGIGSNIVKKWRARHGACSPVQAGARPVSQPPALEAPPAGGQPLALFVGPAGT